MTAIHYSKSGKHHFRQVKIEGGKAQLSDDRGVLIYKNVPISETPEHGKCVVSGQPKLTTTSKTKPKK